MNSKSGISTATASLLLGLSSFLCLCFTGVPAAIAGLIALTKDPTKSERVQAWIGIVLGGLSIVVLGVSMVASNIEEKQALEEERAQVQAQYEQSKADEAALVASLNEDAEVNLQEIEEHVAAMEAALASKEATTATEARKTASELLTPYTKRKLFPDRTTPLEARLQAAQPHVEALEGWDNGLVLLEEKSYIDASASMDAALLSLDKLPDDYVNKKAATGLKREISRKQKGFASKKKKEEDALARALAEQLVCGDRPQPDGWDGGLIAVDRYMKDRAHDPSSIDSEQCSQPVMTDNCWKTTCKVRGKNAFGAEVLNVHTLYLGRHPQISSMHIVIGAK